MNLANWRTTLFGTLTLAAAFVTQYPDLLASILSEPTAKKAAAIAALITGFLTFANAKDRQVSGNGTAADPTRVADGDGGSRYIGPLILLLSSLAWLALLWLPVLLFGGCSGLDGYNRTYSLDYTSADGRTVRTGVTLAPRETGLAK